MKTLNLLKKILVLTCFSLALLSSLSAQEVEISLDVEEMDKLNQCSSANQYIGFYQFEKALSILEKCNKENRDNHKILSNIAYCHFKLGHYDESKRIYTQVLQQNAEDLNALTQLAIIYNKEQRYDKALETYEVLLQFDIENSFYNKQAGGLALRLGKTEIGLNYYKEAFKLNPKDVETAASLSNIYISLKKPQLAQNVINTTLPSAPQNTRLLRVQTRLHYIKEDFSAVSITGQKLLTLKDSSSYILRMTGMAHYHLDQYHEAILLLEALSKKEEEEHLVHYFLGVSYSKLKDFEMAQQQYQLAIKKGIAENIDDYYKKLGESQEAQGLLSKAIVSLKKAHQYSNEKLLLYKIATISEQYYKDKNIALRYYKKYLKSKDKEHPDHERFAAYKIKTIQGSMHMQRSKK